MDVGRSLRRPGPDDAGAQVRMKSSRSVLNWSLWVANRPCLSTPFRIRQWLAQPCQPEPAVSGVKQTIRKPDRAVDAIDAYLRPLLSLAAARLCRSQALDGRLTSRPCQQRCEYVMAHSSTRLARGLRGCASRGLRAAATARPDWVPGAEVDALQHRSAALGAVDRDAEGRIRLWSGLRLGGGAVRRHRAACWVADFEGYNRGSEQPMRSWGHRWRVPCSP
jgi:hypothetical protein